MKTLQNPTVEVKDGKLTFSADIVDQPFNNYLTTRVTHTHFHPENTKHGRGVQSSNHSVFLKSPRGGFAMSNDIFVMISAYAAPETSFAPLFKNSSKPGSVEVVSETPVTYQWEISDDPAPKGTFPPPVAVWTEIEGATAATLDESTIPAGKWIRCKATNLTGTTTTQAAQKK